MTKQYDDELRGVLFKNERRTTDNHPMYKGEAQIDGKKYWLAAWARDGRDGNKFMSLSFELAEKKVVNNSGGDDLPF
jgi:hypothetical protein